MTASNKTAPTTQSSGFLRLADLDLAKVMAEELNGLDATFERIKLPSSGSTVFEVPGENGEMETVKEFSGVILHHHTLFTYYQNKYTGANNPPDCGSFDGVTGQGNPGGRCKTCQHNQFGAGDNGGKTCKNRRRIYILREGDIFPLLLHLPPGSLREFTNYLKRLLTNTLQSNMIVTRFSLKKATNKGNMVYSQARFSVDRNLRPEEYAVVSRLSEQLREHCQHVPIDVDLFSDAEQDNLFIDPETGEIIPTPQTSYTEAPVEPSEGGMHV